MDDTIHRELIGMIIGATGFQRSLNADGAIQNNKLDYNSLNSAIESETKMDKETEDFLAEVSKRWV